MGWKVKALIAYIKYRKNNSIGGGAERKLLDSYLGSWVYDAIHCILYATYHTWRLYYTILYYTVLYYTILYHTIPYHTILYYTILYYTIVYYSILYYTILYYTILYYTETM